MITCAVAVSFQSARAKASVSWRAAAETSLGMVKGVCSRILKGSSVMSHRLSDDGLVGYGIKAWVLVVMAMSMRRGPKKATILITILLVMVMVLVRKEIK